MLPIETEYYRPETLKEALDLQKKFGRQGFLLAGGTDLVLAIKKGVEAPSAIIDVTRIKELLAIEMRDRELHIGGAVTFAAISSSPAVERYAPALWRAALEVGSPQIRNIATIGGNIATASPAGDSLPALAAHDADVVLVDEEGEKRLAVEGYLKEIKSVSELPVLIKEIVIPAGDREVEGTFVKLGRRNALAIARISVAVVLSRSPESIVRRASMVLGAVAPWPLRVDEAESELQGNPLSDDVCGKVVESSVRVVYESIPGRASLPYKIRAVQGVVHEALWRLKNGGRA
jgi:CO/xanthine dehydrogenase FAD-binding subunit